MSEPDILYHYCSLDTFFNIIKNRTLWLSDISKSNDSMELLPFSNSLQLNIMKKHTDLLKEATLLLSENKNVDFSKESDKKFDEILDVFNRKLPFLKAWGICFSEEGDLLSQWRGYADDAKGISIGFSKEYFNRLNTYIVDDELFYIKLDKVSYDEEKINRIIEDKTPLHSISIKSTTSEISKILNCTLAVSSIECPFYKKASFSEEKEWRLAITDFLPSDIEKNKYLDVLKKANSNLFPLEIRDWNYIIKNETLVSYIEIYLNNIKDAVSKIIIGPKSKCTIEDIKQFLIFHGILEDEFDKSIEIVKSNSSYR